MASAVASGLLSLVQRVHKAVQSLHDCDELSAGLAAELSALLPFVENASKLRAASPAVGALLDQVSNTLLLVESLVDKYTSTSSARRFFKHLLGVTNFTARASECKQQLHLAVGKLTLIASFDTSDGVRRMEPQLAHVGEHTADILATVRDMQVAMQRQMQERKEQNAMGLEGDVVDGITCKNATAGSATSAASSTPAVTVAELAQVAERTAAVLRSRALFHLQETWRAGQQFLVGIEHETHGYHLCAGLDCCVLPVSFSESQCVLRSLPAHRCWLLTVVAVNDVNFEITLANVGTGRLLTTAAVKALRGDKLRGHVTADGAMESADLENRFHMGVSNSDIGSRTKTRPC